MDTSKLKKFAQYARRSLMEQVTAKLKRVLAAESPARRERPEVVAKLEERIRETSGKWGVGSGKSGPESWSWVIEEVAYTWFNRFCALRFMDVNGYNRIGVVSPAVGQFQPEILAEAKMGYVDEAVVPAQPRQQILALLDGTASSPDPQAEAYRRLVVAVCNDYHRIMPYLFERIDDYTELLMPDDLLSGNSILAYTREAMTPEACEDVEVIGWLYQFYISEKKDEVFAALKKNKKITPENIPAATQLFTPNWIVRYLVENSLGRLWLLNRPSSKLIEQMDYYIKPEQAETDFLRISKPEEIKICDPACGSGHMLTYAFDLLYAIYEEEGYEPSEIPEKILTHNLYGVEIDERAGELAAFALTMKAREKQRRFFRKPVQPNICVLESIRFEDGELKDYLDFVGRDLFTEPLRETLHQFRDADNFGSLIRPAVADVRDVLALLEEKDVAGQLFLYQTHQKVLKVLRQADFLSAKYHVVVANPPYMGGKGMNGRLGTYLKDNYSDVKSDLFSAFIVRNTELTLPKGQLGFMTPFVWMFISSYEKLRNFLINEKTITSLVQLEYSGFDGATVPICTFTVENAYHPNLKGGYVRLSDFRGSENQGPRTLEAIKNPDCGWFYRASAANFKKIPGMPIAYWVSDGMLRTFRQGIPLGDFADVKRVMTTSDNNQFLRFWPEVSFNRSCRNARNNEDAIKSKAKWFPYSKGGGYRKWYGYLEFFINWEDSGRDVINFAKTINQSYTRTIVNIPYYFLPSVGFSYITSGPFSMRWMPEGFLYDSGGPGVFTEEQKRKFILACMNSTPAMIALKLLNPTLNLQIADVVRLPLPSYENLKDKNVIVDDIPYLINLSKHDWNSYETSWDFTRLPLLEVGSEKWEVGSGEEETLSTLHSPLSTSLREAYTKLRAHWQNMTLEMQRLEEENNRIFIEAYGLQDELTPDVPLNEITLTCNPHYRYGGDKTEAELEALLLADTMRELVSYAVGCMFGRYALDKPGLILANQGETIEDFRRIVGEYLVMSNEEGKDGDQQLSGSDCVAEGDGCSRDDLSGDQAVSQRGDLRADESDTQSSSLDSVEHSRGTGTQVNTGLQTVSANLSGIESRSGDTTDSRSASELSDAGTTDANLKSAGRNLQNDQQPESKTLVTHHSLLDTHYSFLPDDDNVIPMLDGNWFADDIAERFRKFLRVAFGEDHYEENLKFVEQGLNIKGKRNYSIRDYFLSEFYPDHIKRYKKRPIYWLFSSPKGTFNALIYMHRYRPDTVSIVLNDYLREFRTKLIAEKAHLEHVSISETVTAAAKTKALRDIEALNKAIQELDTYERDILYPLATEKLEIDLDDGVKVNYPKFGKALKPIPGLT